MVVGDCESQRAGGAGFLQHIQHVRQRPEHCTLLRASGYNSRMSAILVWLSLPAVMYAYFIRRGRALEAADAAAQAAAQAAAAAAAAAAEAPHHALLPKG